MWTRAVCRRWIIILLPHITHVVVAVLKRARGRQLPDAAAGRAEKRPSGAPRAPKAFQLFNLQIVLRTTLIGRPRPASFDIFNLSAVLQLDGITATIWSDFN